MESSPYFVYINLEALPRFRLMKEGKLVFSEFFMLVEEDGSVVIKLKHFTPELSGWEQKDDFVRFNLVKIGTQEAYFHGLTYRKAKDGTLNVYVAIKANDGTVNEEMLILKPASDPTDVAPPSAPNTEMRKP